MLNTYSLGHKDYLFDGRRFRSHYINIILRSHKEIQPCREFLPSCCSYCCVRPWPAPVPGVCPKAPLYNKLSANRYYTHYSFDDDGDRHKNPAGSYFYDYNLTWYGEYGLLDDLSLFGTLPWKRLKSYYRYFDAGGNRRKINATYNGLGDLETGFKYGLVREPLVVSVQGLTKLAWFYDGGEDVPPGNNQNDYELKLLAGKSLWPFPGYCGLELGYRWRFGAPSDEYRYLLEFGFNPSEKILHALQARRH